MCAEKRVVTRLCTECSLFGFKPFGNLHGFPAAPVALASGAGKAAGKASLFAGVGLRAV